MWSRDLVPAATLVRLRHKSALNVDMDCEEQCVFETNH